MNDLLNRRTFVLASAAAPLFPTAIEAAWTQPGSPLYVGDLAEKIGGRIGVALQAEVGGITTEFKDYYAMCSTFKAPLAGLVLDDMTNGRIAPDREVSLAGVEVVAWSPVIGPMVEAGTETVPVAKLCEAVVTVSDNTAANLLLDLIGGPEGFTKRVQPIASDMRLDRYEPELNENRAGDRRDTTNPRSMARLVYKMLFDGALEAGAAETLRTHMVNCETGLDRLRAGLPQKGTILGDKTGTGTNGISGDVAFVMKEGGSTGVVVASYVDAPSLAGKSAEASAIHAEIGRRVSPLIVSELGLEG